jgi:precorrin-6B methylase 1
MRRALETAAELDIRAALHEERLALLERLTAQGESRREDTAEEASRTLKECRAFLKRLAPELTA